MPIYRLNQITMREIEFVKAVASGNDFVVIDRVREQRPQPKTQIAKLAQELCQRKLSVGADGLLLVEGSKRCDFKMRIFNPDGSEVDMCGNGARCVALYAAKTRICGKKMLIETRAGDLEAKVEQDRVKIKMSQPKDLRLKFDLDVNPALPKNRKSSIIKKNWGILPSLKNIHKLKGKRKGGVNVQPQNVNYINTGVPHVVCFVQGLANFNVQEMGRAIRYHSEFQPQGTNANFIEVLKKGHIRIRTYERGVEQETLACGTGAVAAAIITTYDMQEQPQGKYRVKVDTQGGETLAVYFKIKEDKIDEVFLEGKAKIAYKAVIV